MLHEGTAGGTGVGDTENHALYHHIGLHDSTGDTLRPTRRCCWTGSGIAPHTRYFSDSNDKIALS